MVLMAGFSMPAGTNVPGAKKWVDPTGRDSAYPGGPLSAKDKKAQGAWGLKLHARRRGAKQRELTALYASDLVAELTFFSSLASETPPSRRFGRLSVRVLPCRRPGRAAQISIINRTRSRDSSYRR